MSQDSIRNPQAAIRDSPPRVALVTGTLAEPAMRRVAAEIAAAGRVEPVVVVLNIQVAALMTSEWVAKKLVLPESGIDRAVVPGYCRGDLSVIAEKLGVPVELGPVNLHDLSVWVEGEALAQA